MSGIPGWKNKPFWIRLLHWEYWSFNVIYVPIYPIFIILCLRARSLFFYAAANPKIKNGGFLGESKKEIYGLVPVALQPRTIFFPKDSDPAWVLGQLLDKGFQFPMIGKPDVGARGRGIKKLDDASSVVAYVSAVPFDFHIQEFILYEKEVGIFYYRIPGMATGNISGIVQKEFLKVKGDGIQTIHNLLKNNQRGVLQLSQFEIHETEMLKRIIPAGEIYTVSPYGNHARGALFLDDSKSVNEALVKKVDEICRQIPEFYFGRLDIRYESRELLEQGKSFSILEVNGAGSEPTHIYDPTHNVFFAWKEIVRHWMILLKISLANHRRGCRYLSFSEGVNMFNKNKADSKLLAGLQNKTI